MARGFYDLAIAAPSKAALEAWGAGGNPSHQGVAKEGDDPNVVAATMSRPGVVFKRPAGSNRPFAEHSDLPSELGIQRERDSAEKASPRSRRSDARPRSASGMPESPPPISRRSSSAATPSAGAKRPPGKGGGNGARSRWPKRKLLEEGRGHPDEAEAIEKRSRAEDDRLDKVRERLHAARGRTRD